MLFPLYIYYRSAPGSGMVGPSQQIFGHLRGNLDAVNTSSGKVLVTGWAVDALLPSSGVPPVVVAFSVDSEVVFSSVANVPRPDLPAAGVAPNPGLFTAFSVFEFILMLANLVFRAWVFCDPTSCRWEKDVECRTPRPDCQGNWKPQHRYPHTSTRKK